MPRLDFELGGKHQVRKIRIGHLGDEFDWWRIVERTTGAILGSGFDRDEAVRTAIAELERRYKNDKLGGYIHGG